MRRALQSAVARGCVGPCAVCSLGSMPTQQRTIADGTRSSAPSGKQGNTGSLDIGLDFAKIDFAAVTRATKAASRSDEGIRQAALSGMMSDLDALNRSIGAGTTRHIVGAKTASLDGKGIGGLRPPSHNRSTDAGGGARITLRETLQDCLVSGNWAKAVAYYNHALQESCKAVAAAATPTASAATSNAVDGAEPTDTPTGCEMLPSPLVYDPRFAHIGIGRWQGNHLKLVMRCLFAAESIPAMTQVWASMVQTDAPKHRFDAFVANHVLSDTRGRSSDSVGQLTYQSTRPSMSKEAWQSFVFEWKGIKRKIALDLGRYAEAQQWALNEHALRALHAARTFEERAAQPSSAAGDAAMTVQELNRALEAALPHHRPVRTDSAGAEEHVVSSDATVASLLQKAKDAGLRYNERTYVMLLRHLRVAGRAAASESAAADSVEASSSDTSARKVPADDDSGARVSLWEASPQLADALKLFDKYRTECCGGDRYPSAYVLAEVLDFVKHRRQHDRRVYELVAHLVRPEGRDAFLRQFPPPSDAPGPTPEGAPAACSQSGTGDVARSTIPIPWGGPPNAKVFEVLIRHAMHMRRVDECWVWFDEMNRLGVRGTGVAYHTMMDVAALQGNGGRGMGLSGTNPGAEQILGVYEKMKQVGRDVTSVGTTVNLINAWSNKNQASLRRRLR